MEKKKMLSCLAMGAVALFAVGCGTNQLQERKVYGEGYEILKCDMPDEEAASNETEGAEVTYLQIVRDVKAGKIVETSVNMDFDYTDTLKDDSSGFAKKTLHSTMNLMCDAFEKQGYLDCYYTADGYKYTLTMGMDIAELASSDGAIAEESTLESIKTALETQTDVAVTNCRIEK